MSGLRPSQIVALLLLLVAVAIFVAPPPEGVAPGVMQAGGLVLGVIALWGTGAIAEHLTALGFFLIAMLFQVAPPATIFSGFQSQAFWLVFAGLVIGAAVNRTGLGARLARAVTRRAGESYGSVVTAVVAVGVLLAFVMPSTMGRVVLLIPVVLALATQLGFPPGSRGRAGLVMAATLGTYMPGAAILPAIVPNMIMVGVAETLYGTRFIYGEYLLMHFPVLGALKAGLIILFTIRLFAEPPQGKPVAEAESGPLSPEERRLAVILAVTLAVWLTDFLHHISPAWVALTAAILCLMPRVGMVPVAAFDKEISFRPLFYAAGIFGLGALIAESGLGEILGAGLLAIAGLEAGNDAWNFAILVIANMLTGMVGTVATIPIVLGPIADDIAGASGLPLYTVLMMQVIGFANPILPYTVGPVLTAMLLGGTRIGHGTRIMLPLAVVSLVLLMPLNYLWWRLLGYFG